MATPARMILIKPLIGGRTGMHTPNSPSQPSHPHISITTGFALMLETACEDFEVLQRLIRQETRLGSGSGLEDHRATVCVRMALDLRVSSTLHPTLWRI